MHLKKQTISTLYAPGNNESDKKMYMNVIKEEMNETLTFHSKTKINKLKKA